MLPDNELYHVTHVLFNLSKHMDIASCFTYYEFLKCVINSTVLNLFILQNIVSSNIIFPSSESIVK